MTALQLEPSAHAPWTRTMFGRVLISMTPFTGHVSRARYRHGPSRPRPPTSHDRVISSSSSWARSDRGEGTMTELRPWYLFHPESLWWHRPTLERRHGSPDSRSAAATTTSQP